MIFENIFKPVWISDTGDIDIEKLFSMFQDFWQENSDIWVSTIPGYHEAAPQLVIQAFLQRVVNGEGSIDREYALGKGRTDIMIKWRKHQKIVVELKIFTGKKSYEAIKEEALQQTYEYAVRSNSKEAHIIVFDRTGKMDWKERLFRDSGEYKGMKIRIWGM